MKRVGPALALGLLLACAACGGCAPGYVLRLGWTEAKILMRREPIDALLAAPDLAPALRERLRLVLAARRFAADELGLRVGDSYATFTEVGDEAIVHVVSAAHRDRLEAVTWWYPVAGRVPYRGFFSPADAAAEAAALARDGLDVDVRTAVAFSTLGWFADPLLSTTAQAAPVPLVETVLHELFHATLYVPGESTFNESAATFVGHRGAIAFFCGGPGDDPERCHEARRRWTTVRAEGAVLSRLGDQLRRLYASDPAPPLRERRRRWLAERAVRRGARHGVVLAPLLLPPNNARLLANLVYVSHLDEFEALAPPEASLGAAVARLVDAARDAEDPFAAVEALARPAASARLRSAGRPV